MAGNSLGGVFKRPDSRFWWIRVPLKGRPGKPHLESSKSTRHADAVALLEKRIEQFRVVPGRASRSTVGEILDDYLRDLAARGARALDKFTRQATIVRERLGGRVAGLLEPLEVYDLQQELRKRYAPATVNFVVGFLRSSYKHAWRSGRIERRIEFPRAIPVNNARNGFIDHRCYLAILEELPDWTKDVFRFAYCCGWRRQEVLSLTWDEVDLDARAINLDPARSKNGEEREIPFIGEIADVVTRRLGARIVGVRWFFHHGGKPWSESTLNKTFRKARIAAGFTKTLFHDCRGTAYTNFRRLGVRAKVAREMVGWTSMVMPNRYERVSFEDKEEAAARMKEFIEAKTAEARVRVLPFAPKKGG